MEEVVVGTRIGKQTESEVGGEGKRKGGEK